MQSLTLAAATSHARIPRAKLTLAATLAAGVAALAAALSPAPAAAAVGPDGSFVHGVDIRIPPGTNGMAPKLALAHSSQAGNGPFGMGWRLIGLPTIARTTFGYGVNYDGADTYVAEGGGRLIRQGDGSFFPEIWSGGKYLPYGACGDGPCMWVLKSGSGIDMYFGGTNTGNPGADHSSRIYRAGASGSVRTWSLARVVNTRDQLAYEVTYARDTDGGDYYPQTIAYTTGPGLAAGTTVTFQTEARSDAAATFGQGAHERWDRRINLIRVSLGNRMLREYVIGYEDGSATGRSRIRSVQERGSAGGTLPAQQFTWQEGADSLTMERWMTAQPGTIAGGESTSVAGWFEGDFSGDGRTDRCKIRNVGGWMTADCYVTAGSTFVHKEFARGYDWVHPDPSNGSSQWFSGDFDGDGKSDLAKIYSSSVGGVQIGVHRSTGTGFTQETWTPSPGGPLYSTNVAGGNSQWFTADFNGDSRTDIAVVYNNGGLMNADVYLSTGASPSAGGAGFVYRQWAVSQGGWISTNASAGNSQWFAADFNGDGKADLGKIWNENNLFYSDIHVSTGSGFVHQRWATAQGGWISTNLAAGSSQWFVADFNGDGKTDLGKIWGGSDLMNADVHLSSGRGFGLERWATNFSGWVSTSVSGGHSQWFSGDFNGDGKTDLSRMWSCSVGGMCMDVYPSRNGGFLHQRWATSQGGWIATSERQWFTGDFNGDGRTDLAKFFMSTGGLAGDVHRAGGDTQPDLLRTFSNGVGGLTEIVYSLGLPASAFGTGCGLEATGGGGWMHGGASGNGKQCGIPNAGPRPLVVYSQADNGRADDPGRFRMTTHSYTNGRVKPGGFDEDEYRAQNPDVAQSPYGAMPFGMEKHYNDFGRAEGRYMRMRGADLGFERYEERDEKAASLVQMNFRQDTPYQARPGQTDRTSGPVRLQEKYSYSAWTPVFGTLGINDFKKITTTFEDGVPAYTATQSKTLDAYGFTTRVVDDAGEGYTVTTDTVVTHDAQNWLTGRIDAMKKYRTSNGNVLEWEKLRYNAQRRVDLKQRWLCSNAASCTSSNGSWITVASGHLYDAFGNLTSVKNARGVTTTTTYDTTYRAFVTKVTTDAGGLAHSRTMTYGLLGGGNVDTETDASGQQTRTTTDEFGRKISVESPLGGLERHSYVNYGVVGQQYDESLITVDTRVMRKRSYFDGVSRVFRVEATGDDGKTVLVESEDYFIDGKRRTRDARPRFVGQAAQWTEVQYDGAGRQSHVTLHDGSIIQYAYGPGWASVTDRVAGKSRTTTEYFTVRGRMWKKVDALGGTLVMTYDEMQRPSKVTYQNNLTQVTNAYDSFGQRRTMTDHASGTGRNTTYTYDLNGNPLETLDPRGNRVKLTYDNLNRVKTKQRQLAGATSFTTEATFTYDDPAVAFSKGRLTRVTDPSGFSAFAYDARGRVTTRTTNVNGLADPLTIGLAFDTIGRATHMTFPNGGVQQTTYTDAGNLKQVLFGGVEYAAFSGHSATGMAAVKRTPQTTSTLNYNAKDLVSSLVTTGSGGRELQNNSYTYDEAGNVTAILDARANKVVNGVNTDESQTFVYDQINRLVKATGRYGGVAGTVKTFAYDGGAAGSDVQVPGVGKLTAFGNTVQRTLSYTGQQATSGTGFSAGYDAAGNMTSKTLDGTTWTYVFDHNNRLTQVKRGGVTRLDVVYNYQGERVKKIFYPGNGRTITTYYVPGGYEVRVDSSAPGLFRRTVHVAAGSAGKVASMTTSASKATAAIMTSRQHRALAAAHDASSPDGLAAKVFHLACAMLPAPGHVRTVLLALFALLTVFLGASVLWRRLAQDGHLRGPRSGNERRLTLISRLVIVPLLLVFAVNVSGCGAERGDGEEIELSQSTVLSGDTSLGLPAGTAFYHPSHIGSTSVITDTAGVLHTHVNYLPFGEIDQQRSAGNNVVTQKFAGQSLDEETGLGYFGARYYDPSIGRFISADTIVPENGNNAQGFNRYAYADNNPITYTDPTGHWSWKGFWRGALKFAIALVVVTAIVALAVMTGGAAAAALGLAAGSFWGAVVAGGVSGFLISGALALRSGASFSEALVAAFQGAVVGAIGGGVGQYVQGIGGITKGFGEAVATGGARGLATGTSSAYMNGARGSEVIKAGLFGAASGVTCSAAVYGLDKLAQAYASNEGFGLGKPNTFGYAVGTENGGGHDLTKSTQMTYMKASRIDLEFGGTAEYEGFVEGGGLSRLGASLGANPTSQVHDGAQGWITGLSPVAAKVANVLTMVPACVVANYGIVAQNYPEFFTTGPMFRVFNLE